MTDPRQQLAEPAARGAVHVEPLGIERDHLGALDDDRPVRESADRGLSRPTKGVMHLLEAHDPRAEHLGGALSPVGQRQLVGLDARFAKTTRQRSGSFAGRENALEASR